jgi:predicted pyridoxine 5'-phosphate oxidase superfamily flavin-nucleotide-binding protein
MALLEGACREVLEATEVVTIVTDGPTGPHIAATWGEYVRRVGIEGDRIIIPAGFYHHMQENLERDPSIQLLVASRQVQGGMGPGQGFTLRGAAHLETEGDAMDRVKEHFPWARAALVVEVTEAIAHL